MPASVCSNRRNILTEDRNINDENLGEWKALFQLNSLYNYEWDGKSLSVVRRCVSFGRNALGLLQGDIQVFEWSADEENNGKFNQDHWRLGWNLKRVLRTQNSKSRDWYTANFLRYINIRSFLWYVRVVIRNTYKNFGRKTSRKETS